MIDKVKYLLLSLALLACSSGPKPVDFGTDQCAYCRMTILDENFVAENVTAKGRVYKYDDLKCWALDRKKPDAQGYVVNYYHPETFLKTDAAYFVKAVSLKSPMAGNVAAVATMEEAQKLAQEHNGEIIALSDAF